MLKPNTHENFDPFLNISFSVIFLILITSYFLKRRRYIKNWLRFDLVFLIGSIPSESSFTVSAMGRNQFPMAAMAIITGGHVRVGFEDNVYIEKGVPAKSNGELVEKVVRLAKEFGRPVATPAEAREILGISK